MHTIALARALALYHKILYFGLKPQPNTFIFNPATHEFARMPDASTPYGFDHAILAYGFDYTPSIDDYKLVKAANTPLVAVFSLNGNWSRAFTTRSQLRYGRAHSHVGLISTALSTGYSSFAAELSASSPPLI